MKQLSCLKSVTLLKYITKLKDHSLMHHISGETLTLSNHFIYYTKLLKGIQQRSVISIACLLKSASIWSTAACQTQLIKKKRPEPFRS